jgi:hypothetical protein
MAPTVTVSIDRRVVGCVPVGGVAISHAVVRTVNRGTDPNDDARPVGIIAMATIVAAAVPIAPMMMVMTTTAIVMTRIDRRTSSEQASDGQQAQNQDTLHD